ncbi:MAG TPA: hypothetical protein PLL21_02735, partial [Sedimentibacter sp.]|nr:hypothetical protein [Sedimentibacter sp.]
YFYQDKWRIEDALTPYVRAKAKNRWPVGHSQRAQILCDDRNKQNCAARLRDDLSRGAFYKLKAPFYFTNFG